jgi:hypothetical protein
MMAKDKMALLQAILESGGDTGVLTLRIAGEEYDFKYRPLGYLAKSRCVSLATEYVPEVGAGGQMEVRARFRLDVYKRAAIKEMFGPKELGNPVPITDALLDALSVEVGEQFDAVIPDPFGTAAATSVLKKEPGDSSGETGP